MRPETPSHEDPRDDASRRSGAHGSWFGDRTELAEDLVHLTGLLGSTDPTQRDQHALPLLLSWVESGALDDVLTPVGDGMTHGLLAGLGERNTSSVLRRSGSAQVLAAVLRRDAERNIARESTLTRWADALFTWLLREQDTVSGAVGHGAAALAFLADSRHLDDMGLTVLLDVVADRILAPTGFIPPLDVDQLARAAAHAVVRDLVPQGVLTAWVNRLSAGTPGVPSAASHFLRALHLRLALGSERPECRADVLLELAAAVRKTSPDLFA